eukprot:scaffold3107_cov77-Skeletonema_dohrnii-CCMP3373.AAC.3
MSSVEALAPTLQLDEFEYLKGNLGRDVHYFLLFVVDVVVIGSIASGILVLVFVSVFGLAVFVATIISAAAAAAAAAVGRAI